MRGARELVSVKSKTKAKLLHTAREKEKKNSRDPIVLSIDITRRPVGGLGKRWKTREAFRWKIKVQRESYPSPR